MNEIEAKLPQCPVSPTGMTQKHCIGPDCKGWRREIRWDSLIMLDKVEYYERLVEYCGLDLPLEPPIENEPPQTDAEN